MEPLGLSISSRGGFAPQQFAQYARLAEERGFAAVFATENYSDALALAQAMAAATRRIAVGTAITNVYLRHPVLAALTAATIDELSGGRFLLGLGAVSSTFNEGVLGLRAEPPLRRTREYVSVVRAVLSGEPITYQGEVFQVAEFRAYRRPPRPDLPIYLGALQPRMLALAGEVADGVLLALSTPEQAHTAVERVRAQAESVGRDPARLRVACILPSAVTNDVAAARRTARELVVDYARHPATRQRFANAGYADEMACIAAALAAGNRSAALASVGDAMAEALVLHGAPQDCQARVAAFRAVGVELPILFPIPIDGDWDASIRAALTAFG